MSVQKSRPSVSQRPTCLKISPEVNSSLARTNTVAQGEGSLDRTWPPSTLPGQTRTRRPRSVRRRGRDARQHPDRHGDRCDAGHPQPRDVKRARRLRGPGRVRLVLLEQGALRGELAAARFARRGLAGLIAGQPPSRCSLPRSPAPTDRDGARTLTHDKTGWRCATSSFSTPPRLARRARSLRGCRDEGGAVFARVDRAAGRTRDDRLATGTAAQPHGGRRARRRR